MTETTKRLHQKILLSALFAIAMAYLESSVVVYLRELYYPNGIHFPLREIAQPILWTEIGREAATIVMLYTYARTIGRNGRETFAYFAMNFGIWDIWYYLWLKLLIDWPATILDWDILFLIPAPWIGPVLAPVLVSVALIASAYMILYRESKSRPLRLTLTDWLLEGVAGLVIIWSFLTDADTLSDIQYPETYAWWIFCLGLGGGLLIFLRRILQNRFGKNSQI